MTTTSTIERAFELARSGTCANVDDIRRALKKEGFASVDQHLSGTGLSRQLKALTLAARLDRAPDLPSEPSSG